MRERWAIAAVLCIALAVGLWWWTNDSGDSSDDAADGSGWTDDLGSNDSDLGDDTMTSETLIQKIAKGLTHNEKVNPAYNNPGGLNMQGDLGSVPAAGGTGHDVIGVFSTVEKGWNALYTTVGNLINRHTDDDTSILTLAGIYVLGPNDPRVASGNLPASVVSEAKAIAAQLGVTIDTTLGQLRGA